MELNEIRKIVYNGKKCQTKCECELLFFYNSLNHMCAIDSLTQIMSGGAAYMNI